VKVFDLSIGGGAEWANVRYGDPWTIGSASFAVDGRHLVTSSEDAAAVFWDAETGERTRLLGAGTGAVRLDVSPDGGLVAASTFDALPVRLLESSTGNLVASALSARPDGTVWDLAWNPDGTRLAIIHGPWDQRDVSIVDRAGALVASLPAPEPGAFFGRASFSADGRRLATTLVDAEQSDGQRDADRQHVSVWDWARGEVVRTIDTSAGNLAFDPTGDRLVTDRLLGSVLDVWDTETGERLTTLTGHTGKVQDVTFSRDGSKVATASEDGTARVWDPATGEQLQVLRDNGTVAAVAFNPDGSKLASLNYDGIARVWALDLDDLIAIAEDRLTRGFSEDECRQYLHHNPCPAA